MTKFLAAAAAVLFGPTSALAAAGGCHAVAGTFVNHRVDCVVPALVCVASDLTGDLAGTALTLVTSYDPATFTYTATVTNTLDDGAVITGTIVGTTNVGHSVETFTGGTRQFAHAEGGTTNDGLGGAGTYSGEFCLADNPS